MGEQPRSAGVHGAARAAGDDSDREVAIALRLALETLDCESVIAVIPDGKGEWIVNRRALEGQRDVLTGPGNAPSADEVPWVELRALLASESDVAAWSDAVEGEDGRRGGVARRYVACVAPGDRTRAAMAMLCVGWSDGQATAGRDRSAAVRSLAAALNEGLERAGRSRAVEARLSAVVGEAEDLRRRLLRQERQASVGVLTAGIVHELRNPLNFVNNFAETALSAVAELKEELEDQHPSRPPSDRPSVDEALDSLATSVSLIRKHGLRAANLVDSMLRHVREDQDGAEMFELNALVLETISLAYHGAPVTELSSRTRVETDLDRGAGVIRAVRADLSRVLINLLTNALYSTAQRRAEAGAGYAPVVSVRTRGLAAGVEIEVHDNGVGILPENLERIFQPFFTTKPAGEGTGLGLSISREIVNAHSGSIRVASAVGGWASFTIALPRSGAGAK